MKKYITILFAALAALVFSSCANVHGNNNTVNIGSGNGSGGGLVRGGFEFGIGGGPRMARGGRPAPRWCPPQGYERKVMKSCPPRCNVQTRGGHRYVYGPTRNGIQCVGVLPPHVQYRGQYGPGYNSGSYGHGYNTGYGRGRDQYRPARNNFTQDSNGEYPMRPDGVTVRSGREAIRGTASVSGDTGEVYHTNLSDWNGNKISRRAGGGSN